MTIITVYLMDRLGRRILLLAGLVGMAVSYGVVTGARQRGVDGGAAPAPCCPKRGSPSFSHRPGTQSPRSTRMTPPA